MRICPFCRTQYPDDTRTCPADGLRPVALEDYEASPHDGALGTTMAGRYTLLARVGAGGMGTVYRAEQSPIGRQVALKVLRRDLGRDPETVARFKREAHTLSQLKHPNTVTIFDFGQSDEGLLYLAMELLEGEMLSSRLKRVVTVDLERSMEIAMGVLRSLDEAHAHKIIHRDLKPDNIFLAKVHGRPDEAEVVKVVDFGIAKIQHGDNPPGLDPVATQEGTVFGTPRYMSPEQAQGKPIDGRSDLYAVGVLLYHMITGEPPFTEDDAVIVMAHHIKTVPPRLSEVVPERKIPPLLDEVVARALAKNADERPQTAQAFLTLLEAALDEMYRMRLSLTQQTELLPAVTGVVRSHRRGAGVFVGIALAVTLLVGLTVFSMRGFTAPAPTAPPPARIATRPAVSDTLASVTVPPFQPIEPAPSVAPDVAPLVVAPAPSVAVDPPQQPTPSNPAGGRGRRAPRGGANDDVYPNVVLPPPVANPPNNQQPRRPLPPGTGRRPYQIWTD